MNSTSKRLTNPYSTILAYQSPAQRLEAWARTVDLSRLSYAGIKSALVQTNVINFAVLPKIFWPITRGELTKDKLIINGVGLAKWCLMLSFARTQKEEPKRRKKPVYLPEESKDADGVVRNPRLGVFHRNGFTVRKETPSTRGVRKTEAAVSAAEEFRRQSAIEKALREKGIRWQTVCQRIAKEHRGSWKTGLPILVNEYGVAA